MPIQKIKDAIAELALRYPIKFAALFGSRATGRVGEESDIDIAVFLDDKVSLFSHEVYLELLNVLSRVCGVFEDKIDLTDLKRANILLRYEIT